MILFQVLSVVGATKDDGIAEELIAWLNSLEGGHFNPKQEIRHEIPDDPTSMMGIFAKETIEKGELLNQVPWHGLIEDSADAWFEDDEEGDLNCGIVRNTAKEMKLGEKSKYAPYAKYLLNQRRGQLPSAWSQQGKDLLEELLLGGVDQGLQKLRPYYTFGWADDWYEPCHGDREDEFMAHVAMLVVQRADDDIMVPCKYIDNMFSLFRFNRESNATNQI